MIQLTPQTSILVATQPVDFRKGIDGLASVCKKAFGYDPFSGTVFVFRNRRRTAIKILMYDGQGFWLCQKRLSSGTLSWWPDNGTITPFAVYQLQMLLWNSQMKPMQGPNLWKPVAPTIAEKK
ncbi:MAG TPA: IS66 family insertion sequence element accessory protein TnpB [Bacteroidales bacterium]|nr:IS66 family insertion sequence element accessory protein TnpB [Bacteroidales bacterium]